MSANKSNPKRIGSSTDCDASGGKLPPIPISEALRIALELESADNLRSPRDHAIAILESYFNLSAYGYEPDHFGKINRRRQAQKETLPDVIERPTLVVISIADYLRKKQ